MRFGVLGPLAAWSPNGSLVTIPGFKVRALLAELLAHEGRPVSADRVIDDLWAHELPGNPSGGALNFWIAAGSNVIAVSPRVLWIAR